MGKELEKSGFKSSEVHRVEQRVGHRLRENDQRLEILEAGGLVDSRVLEDLELTTAIQNIEHGLGREWVGAIVCGFPFGSSATVLYRQSTSNNELWIGLALDAAETVTVVVF